MAKTITGFGKLLPTTAAANSTIRFKYASAPATAEGAIVVSGTDVVAKVSLAGSFSVVLIEGYYRVSVDDSTQDTFIIVVDDVVETVDIIDIITPAIGSPPSATGALPIASSTVYGKIKLSSGGFGIPETVASVAAARLLGKVRCAYSKIIFVLGYTSEGDGGGGIFFWKVGGTDADDGAQYLRPSDYSADGVLQKFL